MPLFFILAGYLYKNKGFKQNCLKILWALLIPYLLYQLIFLPFIVGREVLYHNAPTLITLKRCFLGLILGDVVDKNPYFETICGPCWFIMVMMQLRLLFSFKIFSIKELIIMSILSIIAIKNLIINNIDLYFCIDNLLYAIPFFILGIIIQQYKNNLQKIFYYFKNIKYFKSLLALSFCLILILILINNNYLNIARLTISATEEQSLVLLYFAGTIGTIMICLLASLFKKMNNFVQVIAKNTLFIIYFHYQLIFFMNWIGFKNIIGNFLCAIPLIGYIQSFTLCTLISLFNLTINYYIIKFLEKRAPLVLGKGLKNATN